MFQFLGADQGENKRWNRLVSTSPQADISKLLPASKRDKKAASVFNCVTRFFTLEEFCLVSSLCFFFFCFFPFPLVNKSGGTFCPREDGDDKKKSVLDGNSFIFFYDV